MKILICTDASEQADRALRFGAEIAGSIQAEVTLLGVKENSGAGESILNSLRRGQQFLESRHINAEAVVKPGDPIEEIVRRTDEVSYDLVVIGAVRKGSRGPFSMSSKAYRIVKLIKPPVLVVTGNPSPPRRLLICSGGKGYIEGSFGLVEKLAQGAEATVSLLHVMVQAPAFYLEIGRLEEDVQRVLNSNSELGRSLRREKQELEALGIPTEIRLRQGFVLDEIFKELREGGYDLIVTGSSLSTGPLRTYVLGDVTREIVNRAQIPVLVARHSLRPANLKERLREFFHSFSMHPSVTPSDPSNARVQPN